ncbi:kinase-like domain-containing protein [Thelephora terrestris]|uniref:Kinase-like domain-containing protein n=1 Tax=Thelephora terrestris TaxID=56493 RepID=A0A9P6HKY9_9AGAM|nr:kinase-like domain-containing protein [Thelephora terrestris]
MSSLPATMAPRAFPLPTWLTDMLSWDGKSDISRVLNTAFVDANYLDWIKNLKERADPALQRRCIRALRKTCGLHGILPSSYEVTRPLSKPGPRAFASGGFSDVWKLTDTRDDSVVFAVKTLRVYEQDPADKINKKYCKEVVVCKRASHPNILSIEGVAPKAFEFCMVSRWMEHGDILAYVRRYPGVNRLDLLIGVTRGLDYLHLSEVVHGDLKSPNILIDKGGIPRLSDFGLCSITKNIDTVNASTPNHGCTVRYCAPELLDADGTARPEKKKPTNKSDVYSLSMVVVELVIGEMPFRGISDPTVTVMVSRGERPPKPRQFDAPGISPAVWKVAKTCWHKKAERRPEAKEVLRDLEKIANPGVCNHKACTCSPWELI